MTKMFYSLVIRQAQWNTTFQKHMDLIEVRSIVLSSQSISLRTDIYCKLHVKPDTPWKADWPRPIPLKQYHKNHTIETVP